MMDYVNLCSIFRAVIAFPERLDVEIPVENRLLVNGFVLSVALVFRALSDESDLLSELSLLQLGQLW